VNKFSENGKLIIQTKNHSYGCTARTVDSRCPSQQHLRSFHRIENGRTAQRRHQCARQSNKLDTAVCRLPRLHQLLFKFHRFPQEQWTSDLVHL